MKLETFLEKFDQFADAPDAVAKMRELVLWSAFSGAFSAEKRNQPMPEDWEMEGAPTLPDIPSSWNWQRGSEVFDVIRGVSYKKNDASNVPVADSFPLLRANNIGNGINFDELVYVPRDNIRDEQFVRRGDILIAMSSGSKKLVGKAAPIVTDFNGAFGAFCGIIRNKSAIPDAVLARYFQTPQYTSWVTAAGRGIGINNLGKRDLDSLPIPTPPLAEQKRIVEKVDELMALCDRLEAQQQERETRHAALARASLARFAEAPTPANLQFLFHPSYAISPADLRKSILTLAVQGKLVPQDPNDEPAESIRKNLSVLRTQRLAAKKIRNQKVSGSLNPDDLPFSIPNEWTWIRLGEAAALLGGYAYESGAYVPNSSNQIIRLGNVKNDALLLDQKPAFIPDALAQETAQYAILEGDILITMTGTKGKRDYAFTLIVAGSDLSERRLFLNQRVGAIRPFLPELVPLINMFLKSDQLLDLIFATATGTANQANIGTASVLELPFPLPPLNEQRRIVAKVDEMMALVNTLEAQFTTARTTASALLAATLAELTSTAERGRR